MLRVIAPLDVKLWGVYDRGVANQERVVMQVLSEGPLNLALFGLMMGVKQGEASTPIRDKFLWFGELVADPGTWIVVYTSPGSPRITQAADGQQLLIFYWGFDRTQFGNRSIVPILGEFFGLAVEKSPVWLGLSPTEAAKAAMADANADPKP